MRCDTILMRLGSSAISLMSFSENKVGVRAHHWRWEVLEDHVGQVSQFKGVLRNLDLKDIISSDMLLQPQGELTGLKRDAAP